MLQKSVSVKNDRNFFYKIENALILSRILVQYLLEKALSHLPVLLGPWSDNLKKYTVEIEGNTIADSLVRVITRFLVNSKVDKENACVHEECLNLLSVMFSADIYSETIDQDSNFFLQILCENEIESIPTFIQRLFLNFMEQNIASKADLPPKKNVNLSYLFNSLAAISCISFH